MFIKTRFCISTHFLMKAFMPHILGFTGIQMSQMVSDIISFVITILLTVGVLKSLTNKLNEEQKSVQ